jgi:hypothetical protein
MLVGVRQIVVGFVCPSYVEPTFCIGEGALYIKMEHLCVGSNILKHAVR